MPITKAGWQSIREKQGSLLPRLIWQNIIRREIEPKRTRQTYLLALTDRTESIDRSESIYEERGRRVTLDNDLEG